MADEPLQKVEGDKTSDVTDHRTGRVDPLASLTVLYDHVPEGEAVIEVAKGVYWARLPLPWSLDHINVYLFKEDNGWTVVDTGANGSRGRDVWEKLFSSVMNGEPIVRVVATHMHPDHIGLAGWLVEKFDSEFVITQAEYLLSNTLWLGASDVFPESELNFLLEHGLDPQFEAMVRAAGYSSYKKGVYKLPSQYRRIEDGSEITFGGRNWKVIIGRGHSPEHACLYSLDGELLLSGDQILPEITSNVSVHAREPQANPLAQWISSLNRMLGITSNPIVLPSHGPVYRGLEERLNALIEGHYNKLVKLHAYLDEPKSSVECFPALFRRKITGMDFFLALGETVAHLHLLRSLGLAEESKDGRLVKFVRKGELNTQELLNAIEALPGINLRPLSDIMP
ncbi:MBL fold metallo-hydrolase [Kordiimonas sp. SCSIO 12610]|uniref:MBL fold metallo-hydrolase n=1 Tax=Kordiimonas sp. SCSIO 12610 TaxID=2829597 RepID=UPI00210AB2BA|nr:MBL fold metallo-hydrolase [Kordiimonas sp. SCSIO 12610]UTW56746.1 MBL fold metallo-hydrolase [Kordiimonas sp. SCSIO 12610]